VADKRIGSHYIGSNNCLEVSLRQTLRVPQTVNVKHYVHGANVGSMLGVDFRLEFRGVSVENVTLIPG